MASTVLQFGKIIILLILIFLTAMIGVLLFDWLGLTNLREDIFNFVGLPVAVTGVEEPATLPEEIGPGQLDLLRQRKILEALEERNLQLNQREQQLLEREQLLAQKEEELTALTEEVQDMKNSIIIERETNDNKERRLEQQANFFNGMPPDKAVAQMNEMEVLVLVDILRKVDNMAAASGADSLVPYWISLMPPDRAAEVSEKMIEKPSV